MTEPTESIPEPAAGCRIVGEDGPSMYAIVVGLCVAGLVLLWELFAFFAP